MRKNHFARQTLGFLGINNLIIMITRVVKSNLICGKKHSYHDNYGYPPDFSNQAIETVIKQAESLTEEWLSQHL